MNNTPPTVKDYVRFASYEASSQESTLENLFSLRRKFLKRLLPAIKAQPGPARVGLHGDYGQGKSYFLFVLQKELEKDGYKAVYYNAWKGDFTPDPLLGLGSAIVQKLGADESSQNQDAIKCAIDSIKSSSRKLLVNVAFQLAHKYTGVDVKQAIGTARCEKSPDLFAAHQDAEETVQTLSKSLKDIVHTLPKQPLFILIDELDRCRPDYVIHFLGRIKHLFSQEGIVFIISTDRRTLEAAACSQFGGISAEAYLARFFNIRFDLPGFAVSELMHSFNYLGILKETILNYQGSPFRCTPRAALQAAQQYRFISGPLSPDNKHGTSLLINCLLLRICAPEIVPKLINDEQFANSNAMAHAFGVADLNTPDHGWECICTLNKMFLTSRYIKSGVELPHSEYRVMLKQCYLERRIFPDIERYEDTPGVRTLRYLDELFGPVSVTPQANVRTKANE